MGACQGHVSRLLPPSLSPHEQGAHRHEPLVFVQALPAGGDEEAAVLDPARVQSRLFLQLAAHQVPRVCQQFHLHIAGPQLPQQAWPGGVPALGPQRAVA